ncbi:MAG TPA: peptidoglycan DD-metalloendopeptidase family protein [Pseudonocardia sp.]|uniref:M23 family metallopeptidase n=1 Tax=Pseudonocardia sp. TaxID=60912 RepID=UPI002CAB2CCE|nr:peptidoglycan DD-metalloendopeptidase family protein [Pseudonocardia sp.]HTF48264.1 peptidoglycan DD-metalloendopeptidase family protein [Pseudonocardia sp.]
MEITVGQKRAGLARAGLKRAALTRAALGVAVLALVVAPAALVPAVTGPPPVAAALTSAAPISAALSSPPVGRGAPEAADQVVPPGPGERERPLAGFGWPLAPAPGVSRPFQPPSQPYGPGHRGVDLVGTPGQPVLAAGAGVVVYAGPLADRGVVSIDHADGLRTSYEPVRAAVRPGQLVRLGELVGSLEAGHLGCRSAACLHWGLRKDGQYLDPLLLVRRIRVRLLPWLTDEQAG